MTGKPLASSKSQIESLCSVLELIDHGGGGTCEVTTASEQQEARRKNKGPSCSHQINNFCSMFCEVRYHDGEATTHEHNRYFFNDSETSTS